MNQCGNNIKCLVKLKQEVLPTKVKNLQFEGSCQLFSYILGQHK